MSLLASWCGPCLAGIPGLKRLQTTWGDKGVKMVGVGLDEPRMIANVVRTLETDYPNLQGERA